MADKKKKLEQELGLDIDWDKISKDNKKDPLDDVKGIPQKEEKPNDPLDDVKTLKDIKDKAFSEDAPPARQADGPRRPAIPAKPATDSATWFRSSW